MASAPHRLAYLVGQFPAINHGYLLEEIAGLRSAGATLAVASVLFSDRPVEQLSLEERKETQATFYLNRQPLPAVLRDLLATFVTRPLRSLYGLLWAAKLARSTASPFKALTYFAGAVVLGRWMRRLGASHVHTHFSSSIALIAGKIFPISISFTAHGYGELYDPSVFHLREKIRHALFVRAISKYGLSQLMLAAPPESWNKLVYCPLGVDRRRFPARTPGRGWKEPVNAPFEIACVGRLSPEKGQSFLLHALAELLRAGRSVHVHFYGEGPDRTKLEALATSLHVAHAVTFHGWVSAACLAEVYERIDCLVIPSLYEGIPIVLMEAMASGVPCIAPRITGVPELIQDMSTGLLFPPADAGELACAIGRLADSPSLRAAFALRAREHVFEHYDIARNTAVFADLLRERIGPAMGEPATVEKTQAAALS